MAATRNSSPKVKLHAAIDTHVGVEPQLADVARDDLLLLGHQADAERVVDDGLLHGVHLREGHTAEVGGRRAAEGQPGGGDESDVDRVTGLSLFFHSQSAPPAPTTPHLVHAASGARGAQARTHSRACAHTHTRVHTAREMP